ncbi:hypothetical protein SERLA73DRAFT_177498 [Serpula lacrymans var. lacrymans S7.3]|uniref:Uncharacterized protein n=2 Tax=Serpula lacrymans var. lacrymans TaxID=341189 RepID=F8PP20_SERL3|nr:uncharacterized protein SERLADRAFT_461125 [Serpula lacrymans var. lacrymans S7.9]EGO01897.1 hypothetical protein SERLA73DRAFT_177498 [Serpula lacrymans var. lacrymans S7.3]EGO27523.1 hypothetical protein SERLADRAFT_461125 [Serpula lacrymans var. lacrymans S7.9]
MDRFLAPNTSEARAHSQLTENWLYWDIDHPTFNETLIAGCASYQAINRYLTGSDLFIVPRSRTELERILRRYAHDSIHNAISRSRSSLELGGYSRTCHLAEDSIRNVLNTGDNVATLLALHCPADPTRRNKGYSPSPIKTN